ncbi:MAG: tRNA lysidine(34) synthetase TilS [Cyclobacteriaceae bacterium]|nr:tRNA lysidine(34) synthetase TilS [Cyclobacteriaceae bacterium]
MVDAFLAFCKSKNIAIQVTKTLVTVSGGIDSVVLAHLFHKAGAQFSIAHCNFGLRGEESDKDEQFVKNLSEKLGVEFYCERFETVSYAETKGISIQMAARELRYKWFEQIREKANCEQIATAHHKGDTVETVLFNLTKGTGIEGLHGIRTKFNHLVRPLLFATRREISEFAAGNEIEWREDSSNASEKYSRNKIRHSVIPVLEEINPQAQEAIASSANRINETEKFLSHQIEQVVKKITRENGENLFINIEELLNQPGYGYILSVLLKPYGFNYLQTTAIIENLEAISGKLFYSNSHVVNLDREQLIVSPIHDGSNFLKIYKQEGKYTLGDKCIVTKVSAKENYFIKPDSSILALNMDKLKFPLEIRVWQKGDAFYPLGMKGKKKLSDFMIDAKIPVNLKNNVWVVVSGNEIAGVLNHRLDDRFKITNQTKTVFEIASE